MPYDIFLEALHDNEVDVLKAYPVLVLCDNVECAHRIVQTVRKRGLEVMCCSRVSDAHSLLSRWRFKS